MRFMNTLTKLNNNIPEWIKTHINLFDSFEHVYVFGSILNSNISHNDIDLLLIYAKYSIQIRNDLRVISDKLERASGLPVDLTALSVEEENNTAFLEKIKPRYLKLK